MIELLYTQRFLQNAFQRCASIIYYTLYIIIPNRFRYWVLCRFFFSKFNSNESRHLPWIFRRLASKEKGAIFHSNSNITYEKYVMSSKLNRQTIQSLFRDYLWWTGRKKINSIWKVLCKFIYIILLWCFIFPCGLFHCDSVRLCRTTRSFS